MRKMCNTKQNYMKLSIILYKILIRDILIYLAETLLHYFFFSVLKTGASGMIAYRFQTKDGGWQWLQTSSRLVYKNSKPDFVLSTHRPLM